MSQKESPLFSTLKAFLPFSLCFALSYNSAAIAEEIRVFPGQYVVEVENSIFSNDADVDASVENATGLPVAKRLGKQAMLLGSKSSSLSINAASSQTVPYDPTDDFCARAIKSGTVSSCSPNFEIKIDATPNDPDFGELWGMQTIQAEAAWNLSKGSSSVVVAIIDTGIDYNHPDLAANMWKNPGEIAGNHIDDDNNGVIDDVYGYNATNDSGNPMDDNGHGTHCAGTIGGAGNNGKGVAGVNWSVKLMALKFLSATGSGSLADAVTAINYMVMMRERGVNIKVSSNSWGGGGFSQALMNAISAANDAGILFVAAAGNEANDNDLSPSYPASYDVPNVVSVAAIGQDGNLASFSNYGFESVDIAAPGVGIYSTKPGNNYQKLSGTSMATPHVAGAAALLFAYAGCQELSIEQAVARLLDTGIPTEALNGKLGDGRVLNLYRLLKKIVTPRNQAPEIPACAVSIQERAYAEDTLADATPVRVNTDENGFYTFDLPFVFPFHRQEVTQITVSPNGVAYMGKPVGLSMDYRPGSVAPRNSIAALHTDMIPEGTHAGVRVGLASNRVVIYWDMVQYYDRSANVSVRLSLFPNGNWDINTDIPAEKAAFVTTRATVGSTGTSGTDSSATYSATTAFSTPKGLHFAQTCPELPEAPTRVKDVTLSSQNQSGRIVDGRVYRGRRMIMRISAEGADEQLGLHFGFNQDVTCDATAEIKLQGGKAVYRTRIPRNLSRSISSLEVTVNAPAGSVYRSARVAKAKRRTNSISTCSSVSSISQKQMEQFCNGLLLSLASKKR